MIIIEGVEKMKKKMLSQASAEAERILKEAKKEAENIKAENEKKVSELKSGSEDRIKSEVALMKNRELASASMKGRKSFMEEREEIIDGIIEKSLAVLNKDKGYPSFIEKNLKQFSSEIGKPITVFCRSDDKGVVEKALSKLKIEADVKKADIRAGFILKGKETRIDLSIESILEEKRMDIRKEIVDIIGA